MTHEGGKVEFEMEPKDNLTKLGENRKRRTIGERSGSIGVEFEGAEVGAGEPRGVGREWRGGYD